MPERRKDESAKRTSEEQRPEQGNELSETGGGAQTTEAQDVVRMSTEAAMEGAQTAGAPSAMAATEPVQAAPAAITDEMTEAAPAFGQFVKSVGLAVAEAQTSLDKTLVETAKALSDTQIDVIAVFEQQIDDNGQMEKGNVHKEKLPLVNYIMPTAYKWDRVYLQANMKVKEFNTSNGFNIQGKSSSFAAGAQANYGFAGFGASGSVRYSSSNYQYGGEISSATDEAAGDLQLEATLEPREDIQLPRPFVLQKGPRLKITAGARTDMLNEATPPEIIGRQVTLTADLKSKENNALTGKQLEYSISQPLLNYETFDPDNPSQATNQTNAKGQLGIKLTRSGAAFDRTRAPEPVTVTVWLGLVSQQVVVSV